MNECLGSNSSGNMELESFQLPNSTRASALGFVLLIHPQGYFWIPPPGRTGLVLFLVFLGEQLAEGMTYQRKTLLAGGVCSIP